MPTLESFRGVYLWNYVPSLPAAVVFAALFAIITIAHTWKMITTRSWFCIAFVVGGICEVIGYANRAVSTYATGSLGAYLIQAIFLVIAPVFFAASLYMMYSRIVIAVKGERWSLVSPRWTTTIFVIGDLTCLNIQSGGAGLEGHQSIAYIGNYIIVSGLVAQVLVFIGFMYCCFIFNIRFKTHIAETGVTNNIPWQSTLNMLYLTSVAILVRNIYRIIEFITGQNGYLLQNEWPLYVFDGVLMLMVMVGFYIWYPSRLQPSTRDSVIELISNRVDSPEINRPGTVKNSAGGS